MKIIASILIVIAFIIVFDILCVGILWWHFTFMNKKRKEEYNDIVNNELSGNPQGDDGGWDKHHAMDSMAGEGHSEAVAEGEDVSI